jgi:hypothetical protein
VILNGDGVRAQVTLLKFIDPATSCCYRPRRGTRFVVFQIRYVNVSKTAFRTVPAADSEFSDSAGRIYDSLTSSYGSRMQPWPVMAPDLNHGFGLRPRERWTGYLGWVVPSNLRLSTFRYAFAGSSTAIWRLRTG